MRPGSYIIAIALVTTLCGCVRRATAIEAQNVAGGNAAVGRHLVYAYGCGTCHVIPGIAEAKGTVGPPLAGFASRIYIAGSLLNAPDNLIHWVTKPKEINPGSAMPDLGVTDLQARDMAAYLYTLR
ncbi:MAG: c-type cytochrome [Acidobacteriaceae bacterium]|nr:c-type cytochrome [Acidobacteriaceae bacterium]